MGSWYNLIGEDLSNCITNKCGNIPVRQSGLTSTPQMEAEFQARRSAWLTCKESCEKARFNLAGVGTLGSVNTSGVTPLGGLTTIAPTRNTGETTTITNENANVRPLGIGTPLNRPKGISKNTILIGVGVLAVVAFFMLRRK